MTSLTEIMLPAWLALPPGDAVRLAGAHVPRCLLDAPPAGLNADPDGLVAVDIDLADGRVAAIAPAGLTRGPATPVDLDGGQVWPCFVDLHTHLDKGHIWPRMRNPDGTFDSALASVGVDRSAHWRAEDVAARMEFSVECAYAHGTAAVRTHLDSIAPQHRISWPVFAALREKWAGRIDLQAASIVGYDYFRDRDAGRELADLIADHGGLLGAVTYPLPDAAELIGFMFDLAIARGLDMDLHVDEYSEPDAGTQTLIAETALAKGFKGKVNMGHCCVLASQPDEVAEAAIARTAAAGLSVVSLPMCNLYLQDRTPGRTPRRRGVTLLHELGAAGVPVAVASDNTRDPFYACGDLDMLEVFTQSARIGQLEHPFGDWAAAVARTPADIMGLGDRGRIAVGGPADLVLFRARSMSELLARPQVDRVVLRGGRAIARRLPDYRRLDPLFADTRASVAEV